MSLSSPRLDTVIPRSRFYHGPFGRLFPDLAPWRPAGVSDDGLEEHFLAFARDNMVEAPGRAPTEVADDDTLRTDLDSQFNSALPAGYTYFGQFIDHDITLDTTPLSQSEIDPNRLHNFRTPRLDLDCVYGSGPGDQPYLYEHDGPNITGRMLTGAIAGTAFLDLARNAEGRAIIGDKRNDENAVVAQLQLAFILAHNTLVDRALARGLAGNGAQAFAVARRTLQWLYQWIVWNDFIRRVTVDTVHGAALAADSTTSDGRRAWRRGLTDVYSWSQQPFMPVEFSVAAYRFGHSLVRNSYQTNASGAAGFHEFIPIFDVGASDDLRGFRPLDQRRVIQWDWFLEMTSSSGEFPQPARQIDTKLSNALAALPENPAMPDSIDNMLAARNLVRAVRMQLPSGPDVARSLCIDAVGLTADEPQALWYSILKEAEVNEGGARLGQLGSVIVCSVFAGLIGGDPRSWINLAPCWTPDADPLLDDADNADPGEWTLASVIRLSGLPVDGGDF